MLISSIACGKSDRVMSCLHQRRGGKGARSWRTVALSIGIVISALAPTAATSQVVQSVPFNQKLVASAGAPPERLGSAAATSGDVFVTTAPGATVDGKVFAGAAYVFERDPSTGVWLQSGRLAANDGVAFNQFGSSVAVEGGTIFVGTSRAQVNGVLQQGAVYVFQKASGVGWAQVAKLTDSVGIIGSFGSSIAAKDDLLAVGASRGRGNGQVTIFQRDRGGPGAWGKVTAIFDSDAGGGGSPLENFGSAVALDGDTLVVGASSADVSYFGEDDGAAYIFSRDKTDSDRWNFVTRLTEPDATVCPAGKTMAQLLLESPEFRDGVRRCATETSKTDHDAFGSAVALVGDTIVVGAPAAEADSGPVVGAAFVFSRDPGDSSRWPFVAKLSGHDLLASDSPGFGQTVALNGDSIVVGAPGTEFNSQTDQGAAYVFQRDAGNPDAWLETAKLVAGDGLSRESFGASIVFDGSDAIIGASGYELGQGAIYLTAAPRSPPGPAFPPTGQLTKDGVVTAPDGAMLGALGTPLDAPVPVWIQTAPQPASPALGPLVPVGAFYNVGATSVISPAVDTPLALALPVPVGTDATHLSIALLPPPNLIGEGGGTVSWLPMPGNYNPESQLFSIVLPSLFPEGTTAVLVQDPDSTPMPPPNPRLAPAPSSTACPPPPLLCGCPQLLPLPDFAIGGCSSYTDKSQCQPSDVDRLNTLLRTARDKFIGLGFGCPRLLVNTATTTVTAGGTTFQKVVGANYYNVAAAEPGPGKCSANYYDPNTIRLTICYGGAATPEADLAASIRHEMFHAIQHGFDGFHQATPRSLPGSPFDLSALEDYQWINEGTATAAEDSNGTAKEDPADTMHRDTKHIPPPPPPGTPPPPPPPFTVPPVPLHPITRALTATGDHPQPPPPAPQLPLTDLISYSAQDFWVYVGNRLGPPAHGLTYLTDLFVRGATPDAVDSMLSDVHQTSLAKEYWSWVKNQAIEKTDSLDEALADPCNIVLPRDNAIIGTPWPLVFPAADIPPSFTGTLARLTATTVKITVLADSSGKTDVTAISADPGLAFKVYANGEPRCADVADGNRTFDSLKQDTVLFVVLANTNHRPGDRLGFTVTIRPAAKP